MGVNVLHNSFGCLDTFRMYNSYLTKKKKRETIVVKKKKTIVQLYKHLIIIPTYPDNRIHNI